MELEIGKLDLKEKLRARGSSIADVDEPLTPIHLIQVDNMVDDFMKEIISHRGRG